MKPAVSLEGSAPAPLGREHRPLLRILAVANEAAGELVQRLQAWAGDAGLHVEGAPDLPRAVRQLAAERWDVVVAALGERADEELTWWVDALRGAVGGPRLVAAAETPSMGLVLRAEKLGVRDLLSLPLRREDLLRALERLRAAVAEVPTPLPQVDHHAVGPYALVGRSPAMLQVYQMLARVAGSTATVLIQGESGTGKEVVARAIHLNGPKASGPFVAVNCAAIP
jgi:two-component system, NtrC family, response regulator HydG